MNLIAVIAVVATAMQPWSRQDPVTLTLLLSIPPVLLMTESQAKRRRSRGVRMTGWERVVSVVKLTVWFWVLLFFTLKTIYSHR